MLLSSIYIFKTNSIFASIGWDQLTQLVPLNKTLKSVMFLFLNSPIVKNAAILFSRVFIIHMYYLNDSNHEGSNPVQCCNLLGNVHTATSVRDVCIYIIKLFR